MIREVANRYLNGESLRKLARELRDIRDFKISYNHLIRVLHNHCGDKWKITYRNKDPFIFDVPPILDKKTIKAVKERLKFNQTFNRKDAQAAHKYLLSGFIRCEECGGALCGQRQKYKEKEHYYYRHQDGKDRKCRAFSSIKAEKLEKAFFEHVSGHILDEESFNRSLEDSYPDENQIADLKQKVNNLKSKVQNTELRFENLLKAVEKGSLQAESIKSREAKLIKRKEYFDDELKKAQGRLDSIPKRDDIDEWAGLARRVLLSYFRSEEHFSNMPFEEKRRFLHNIFDGSDSDGKPYSIYLFKDNSGEWILHVYGRIINYYNTLELSETDKIGGIGPSVKNYKSKNMRRSHGNHQDIQHRRSDFHSGCQQLY